MLYNKKKLALIALALLCGEILISMTVSTVQQDAEYSSAIYWELPMLLTGPIIQGRHIEQQLIISHERLTAIDIFFSTYARKNTGTLQLELRQQGNMLYAKEQSTARFDENGYYRWNIPTQQQSQGQMYILTLSSPDGTEQSSVTSRYGIKKLEGTQLTIDGKSIDDGMLFVVPQYEVGVMEYIQSLAKRIKINKGNLVPPGVVYGVILTLLWCINASILFAVKALYEKDI